MKQYLLVSGLILSLFLGACTATSEPEVPLEEVQAPVNKAEETVPETPSPEIVLTQDRPPYHSEELGDLEWSVLQWTGESMKRYTYCTSDVMWTCETVFTDLADRFVKSPLIRTNSAYRWALSPNERYLAHVEDHEIRVYDFEQGQSYLLMSVLENTDGVDFYWSPSDETLVMTVVNQLEESYRETYGTKLYVLEFEDGQVTRKDRHLLRIRYECHSGGCNTLSDDVYFEDENTLVYRIWESATPYDDAGREDLLRKLEL